MSTARPHQRSRAGRTAAAAIIPVALLVACSGGEATDGSANQPSTRPPGAAADSATAPDAARSTTTPPTEAPDLAPDLGAGPTEQPGTDLTAPTSEANTSTQAPAPEPTSITANTPVDGAFTVDLPEGWVDVVDEVSIDGTALAVRAAGPTSDIFTNVAISVTDPVPDLQESVQRSIELSSDEGQDVTEVEPIQIDGVDAIGYTVVREDAEPPTVQTQWWFEHDDHLFIASVTSHVDQQQEADAAFTGMVDSWRWRATG